MRFSRNTPRSFWTHVCLPRGTFTYRHYIQSLLSLLEAWKNLFWLVLFWNVEFLTQRFANQQHVVPCWMCTLNRNSIPSISASDFEVFRAAKMARNPRITIEPLLRSTTSRKACRTFLLRRVSAPHKLRSASERATARCSDDSSSRALQIGFTFRASCHYVFFRTTSSTTAFLIWKDHQKITIFRPLLFESNLRIFQFSLQI